VIKTCYKCVLIRSFDVYFFALPLILVEFYGNLATRILLLLIFALYGGYLIWLLLSIGLIK